MRRLLPYLALALFCAELLLMLVSWLLSAVWPMSGVRSLLSGEGLRWLFGHFSGMMATPALVWLLLLSMAAGCLRASRLLRLGNSYRESRALILTVMLLAVYVTVLLLLTALPHAVLRSVVGGLWPSPFSHGLVPMLAFVIVSLSAFYGLIAGHFGRLSDIYDSLLDGVRAGAPLLLFYVLLIQFYESLMFVLP